MTREQIEELEQLLDSGDWMPDSSDTGDLLRIAKRALALEDVLAAAKEVREGNTLCRAGACCDSCDDLRAAIDRAEGKP